MTGFSRQRRISGTMVFVVSVGLAAFGCTGSEGESPGNSTAEEVAGQVESVSADPATDTTSSQSGTAPTLATYVTAEEIQTVVKSPGGGDREVKIVDMGRYNLGVAVLRRGATKPGATTVNGINHTEVTEVYYVVSGEGTLVTGGEVTDVEPVPADSELVTTVIGASNRATFVKPAQTKLIKQGDVVIIPAGTYHGFSDVPDHIEYVSVRPDINKVLPAGYVNPALTQ